MIFPKLILMYIFENAGIVPVSKKQQKQLLGNYNVMFKTINAP